MKIPFMKNKNFIILALAPVVLLSAGCDWRGIRGNGKIKTETRPVSDFTRLDAGGFYNIQWKPGAPSLSVTTDENLLSHIETRVDGSTLRIDTRDQIYTHNGIKIAITSPSLRGADLSGALKLEAAQLSGDRFALETSGASKVTLSGSITRLLASLTGASRLNAESLQAQDVEIAVTGAGRADIFASNSVKAAITGAGKVNYAGNPKEVQKKVTGAGKISPR
ncbi:head GIN domain-containing protein [soil metagenome]